MGSPVAVKDVTVSSGTQPDTSGWKYTSLSVIKEANSDTNGNIIARDISLDKRVFTSPHMKRAFRVVVANAISAATWVIDFTLNEASSSQVTINYKLQSSLGLESPSVEIPSLTKIYESDNQFRGNAKVELIGKYAGKVVHIYFNGEVFGSQAAMIWQKMISEPVCYVNGVQTAIKSWTFDQVP